MAVNMSFSIQATTARELASGIRQLAAIIGAAETDIAGDVKAAEPAPQSEAKAEPEPAPQPEPQPEPKPKAEPEPKPTASIEAVRLKLAELVQAGKQAEVKQLLESFGAAKLSDVPPERYGELLAKAGEIG